MLGGVVDSAADRKCENVWMVHAVQVMYKVVVRNLRLCYFLEEDKAQR